jgi:alpha-N-arabinofuranosidase
MYKHHQDADLVESFLEGNCKAGVEEACQVPMVSESVSVDKEGILNLTISNASLSEAAFVETGFAELTPSEVQASVLTGRMNAYNSFENPDCVREEAFTDYRTEGKGLSFTIPAGSIVSFRIR